MPRRMYRPRDWRLPFAAAWPGWFGTQCLDTGQPRLQAASRRVPPGQPGGWGVRRAGGSTYPQWVGPRKIPGQKGSLISGRRQLPSLRDPDCAKAPAIPSASPADERSLAPCRRRTPAATGSLDEPMATWLPVASSRGSRWPWFPQGQTPAASGDERSPAPRRQAFGPAVGQPGSKPCRLAFLPASSA